MTTQARPVPIIVLGDAPNQNTGLARIARDLAALLHSMAPEVEVCQLGLNYDGSPWPWRVFPIRDTGSWGAADVSQVWGYHERGGFERGVLLSVWDPGRCFGWLEPAENRALPLSRWGYFAVDSAGPGGRLGGPAAAALGCYDRVLGYGRYGAEVLRRSLPPGKRVQYLPHGIDLKVFHPRVGDSSDPADYYWPDEECTRWVVDHQGSDEAPRTWVGCVATNQPRKDFGLLFQAVAALEVLLKQKVGLWLHTDETVTSAWSVPQLAEDWGRNDEEGLLVTRDLSDETLSRMYSLMEITIAPGLGEGFGYPIVESLACGTPVIHGDWAGGAELVPRRDWRVSAWAERVEGAYGLVRPVFNPIDFAEQAAAAIKWRRGDPAVVREFCRGSVANLDWRRSLWGRWTGWVREGLGEMAAEEAAEEARGGRGEESQPPPPAPRAPQAGAAQ